MWTLVSLSPNVAMFADHQIAHGYPKDWVILKLWANPTRCLTLAYLTLA